MAAKAARIASRTDVSTSADPEERSPVGQEPVPDAPTGDVRSEPAQVKPAVRVRPVRLTVDVPPADHAALRRHLLDAAVELGVARVDGQDVMRALLRRYLGEEHLRRHILADLETRLRGK